MLRIIKDLEVEQGPIDVVVANAGIAGGGKDAVAPNCMYLFVEASLVSLESDDRALNDAWEGQVCLLILMSSAWNAYIK